VNTVNLLTRALTAGRKPAADSETADRILDAARRQVELFGIRKTTMEDVARRSGISRVTVYRHFPNKDELVEAVIMREARALLTDLLTLVNGIDNDEDRIVESFVFIVGSLRDHTLLRQLLHGEPEVILPQFTIEAGPQMVVGYLERHNGLGLAHRDLEVTAEAGIRLAISLILTPDSVVDFDDPEGLRRLVRRYILPFADSEVIELVKTKGDKKGRS
jgi:AcrR family transcriptional regulator